MILHIAGEGFSNVFKKTLAALAALLMLGSVTACYMPDSIFPDNPMKDDEEEIVMDEKSIYNFQFNLDGTDYELPMRYTVLSSRGWKLPGDGANSSDDMASDLVASANKDLLHATNEQDGKLYQYDTMMEPGEFSTYLPADKGSEYVALKFYNDGKKAQKLEECLVVGLMVEKGADDLPQLTIDGNVSLGDRYENVVITYGKPSYMEDVVDSTGELAAINEIPFINGYDPDSNDLVRTLHYAISDTSSISFELGDYEDDDDAVLRVRLENKDPIDEPYNYKKDLKSRPSIIRLYKGPSLLGKSFSDFAFKYEGNLYTLPMPVKTLVDNGWVFVQGASDKVPVGTTADGVIMHKGNLAMSILVHNYDLEKEQTPINCYAVSLRADIYGPNVKLLMPKGVTLGSNYDELATAFGREYKDLTGYVEKDEESTEEETEVPMPVITEPVGTTVKTELTDDAGCYIEKRVEEEYTVYSYVMPDDVPSIPLPVSITDIKDPSADLLGANRKHIDVYLSNQNGRIVRVYLQNCPEYVVNEAEVLEQQLIAAEKAAKEEQEKAKAAEQAGETASQTASEASGNADAQMSASSGGAVAAARVIPRGKLRGEISVLSRLEIV